MSILFKILIHISMIKKNCPDNREGKQQITGNYTRNYYIAYATV